MPVCTTLAAVNVAVTKTPITTSVILSVLSDTSMIPVVAIASFISFFLTSNIYMLKTSAIAHATLWQYHNCAISHGVSWEFDVPRERLKHVPRRSRGNEGGTS
ncbi:MAG: hypothetical protein GDA48_27290 [Hormoscilla sp. GM102CHS1]|nr:hypothetical protein [Hormoscilla sp. GM102CHS1]